MSSKQRKQKIQVGIVDLSTREGWDRSLAYWIIAKNSFENGVIYNYSIRRLADVMNVSVGCAHHHLSLWEKKGLIRYHSGNLVFTSIEDLDSLAMENYEYEKSCTNIISLFILDNVNDQLKLIKSRQVVKNVNQQARNIRLKREVLLTLESLRAKSILTSEEAKAYKRLEKKRVKNGWSYDEYLKSGGDIIFLSDYKCSELMGSSVGYAKQVKALLVKLGVLSKKKVLGGLLHDRTDFTTYNKAVDAGYFPKQSFWLKGKVYQAPKTAYSIGTVPNAQLSLLSGGFYSQALSTGH